MTHSGVRQRNLIMHGQCPLPVYYSQVLLTEPADNDCSLSFMPFPVLNVPPILVSTKNTSLINKI